MKKSTITVVIAITGLFLCFTVVNLKLKREYDEGNIQSPMKINILPVFHHIKDISPSSKKENVYSRNIMVFQKKDSSALVHDYYIQPSVKYYVKNDTLFLEPDSTSDGPFYLFDIYCKDLKSINASRSSIRLVDYVFDSMSLTTSSNASIHCEHIKSNFINMNISGESSIFVSATDTINKANIYIQNSGLLNAANVYFKEKNLTIKNNGSVRASGESLKNFGVLPATKN